ncbi:MAG: response regulator [Dehalococcoidia bacterium]
MPKLVLVIDDERPIRDLVSSLLSDEGYPVRTYSSAQAALVDITTGSVRPDVVLLDMRMPGMDGPQFAEALRSHSPGIPIVVMTAARDARQWAEEINAAGYLPKPFDIDWVIDTLEGVIGPPDATDGTDGADGAHRFTFLPLAPRFSDALRGWAACRRRALASAP